jgi:hypothetical protein
LRPAAVQGRPRVRCGRGGDRWRGNLGAGHDVGVGAPDAGDNMGAGEGA